MTLTKRAIVVSPYYNTAFLASGRRNMLPLGVEVLSERDKLSKLQNQKA